MKARDLKNIKLPINVNNSTYYISFNFNSCCELEEVYPGGFDKALKDVNRGSKGMSALRALLYSALKVNHSDITLNETGLLITAAIQNNEMDNISEQLLKAIELFNPTQEQIEETTQGE